MDKSSTVDKKSNSTKTASSNDTKGRIVEQIAANMHDLPGVKVEQRVKLPSILSKGKREREIDVLLTGDVAGYAIQLAIECKNEGTPIKPEKIDAFVGKLQDVGIPVR